MRIAIVDDEVSIRFSLKKFFELRAFTVDVAETATEAEDLIRNVLFDVVLLDIHLTPGGEVEGLDLIRAIRCHSPNARIVVLSGYLSAETIDRARQLGADLILNKPQPLHELETVIRSVR